MHGARERYPRGNVPDDRVCGEVERSAGRVFFRAREISRFQSDAVGPRPAPVRGAKAFGAIMPEPPASAGCSILSTLCNCKSAEFLVASCVSAISGLPRPPTLRAAASAGMARRIRGLRMPQETEPRGRHHRHMVHDRAVAGQRQSAGSRAARELPRADGITELGRIPLSPNWNSAWRPSCGACSSRLALTATRRLRRIRARDQAVARRDWRPGPSLLALTMRTRRIPHILSLRIGADMWPRPTISATAFGAGGACFVLRNFPWRQVVHRSSQRLRKIAAPCGTYSKHRS